MLYNVQVLRAVAALLVVHAHAANSAGLGLAWTGGAHGVDLFFVISGFIIAYVASLDTDQFMTRRLIRIVPIYWASTLFLYALVVTVPQYFRTTSSDPILLVRSLAFLPTSSSVHTSDGIPHPTLSGGWTLNYEMYFYVTFAIALSLSHKRATVIATGLILAVMGIVRATGLDGSPIAYFYAHPIVLEFVLGMIAFHVVRAVEGHRYRAVAPRLQKAVLALIVVGGLGVLAFIDELFGRTPRWISGGLAGFAVVVAAVLLERVHDVKITNRVAVAVGDASYVLYLIHAYLVFGIIRLVFPNHPFGEWTGQLVVVGLMAVSALVAVATYRYFEQPILRWLKVRFIAPRPSRRQAPSLAQS